MMINELWVEKHRPKSLDKYVFHDIGHKKSFEKMINNKSLPHLLLSGIQGSGKTTIAEILLRELNVDSMDYRIINASDENSVTDMRDKIKAYIETAPFGDFKVVLLEEADYLSLNAQAILRKFMENVNSSARFILTCNYENKIIPALKSRTQHFRFKAPDKDDVTLYAVELLIAENVAFDLPTLDEYVSVGYPDIRKIVNLLQQHTIDNKLERYNVVNESFDYKFQLIDYLNADDWEAARMHVCSNVLDEEWDDLYKFLYDNIHRSSKFSDQSKWENAILTIADHLGKNSLYADREINAAAMFIKLKHL